MRWYVFLFILCISGCAVKENPVQKKQKLTLEDFHRSDWSRHSAFETLQLSEMVQRESLDSLVLPVHAERKTPYSASEDLQFVCIENALAAAVGKLYPRNLYLVSEYVRRMKTVFLWAETEKIKELEAGNFLTQVEKTSHIDFLLSSNVVYGCKFDKLSGDFDFSSLPGYASCNYVPVLPEWLKWSENTPALWADMLGKLPDEVVRTPGIDRKKLSLLIFDISCRISARVASEYLKKIEQAMKSEQSVKKRIMLNFQKHVMMAYLQYPGKERVSGEQSEFSKESVFLKDIYTLSRP